MRLLPLLLFLPTTLACQDTQPDTYIPSLLASHSLSPPHIFTRRIQPSFTSHLSPHITHPPLRNPAPLSLPIRHRNPIHVRGHAELQHASSEGKSLLLAISSTPEQLPSLLTTLPFYSNRISILVALHGSSPSHAASVQQQLRQQGLDVDAITTADTSDQGGRYAQLMQELMKRRVTGRWEWFGVADGDLVVVGLGRLSQYLEGLEGEVFVGAPGGRRDWEADSDGREVTYGGGFVVMSREGLDLAGQLLCLQYTKTSGQDDEKWKWDRGLFECLRRYTDVKLRALPGLYDPETGVEKVYGDGKPLVVRTGRDVDVKGHLVTKVCGDGCFVQRYVFADNWVLVNGHTLTHYPEGVEVKNNEMISKTRKVSDWIILEQNEEGEVTLVSRGRQKTWRLLESKSRGNGEVWQVYVNRKGVNNAVGQGNTARDEEEADGDSAVVLIWEPPR